MRESNLKKFHSLLSKSIGKLTFTAVFDGEGSLLGLCGDASELDLIKHRLKSASSSWIDDPFTVRHFAGDESTYVHTRLTDGYANNHGVLVLSLETLACNENEVETEVAPVVECLVNELALNAELDAMTRELTERYEELNLVYHTEDQANAREDGQKALERLVRNCSDYLNVAFACLILKNKQLRASTNNSTNPIPNDHQVLDLLQGGLYDHVISTNEPAVINSVSDNRASQFVPGLPYKILACPVDDGLGNAIGMIAILNHYADKNFSNSDRNLVTVLARKAGKVIQAKYDSLTGLRNRASFEFMLEDALVDSRNSGTQQCIFHLDIDKIKVINDNHGMEVGDRVIRWVARRIEQVVRDSDIVARTEGDVFTALLKKCSPNDGDLIARKVLRAVSECAVDVDGELIDVSASIGVAVVTPSVDSASSVMTAAEVACELAKEQGRNRVQLYHHDDLELVQRQQQMHWVGRIQRALSENRFQVYSQVIAPLQHEGAPHYELLLRMLDEEGNICPPGSFMPAAERYHMMPDIDRWVVENSLAMIGEHKSDFNDEIFSINLSGQTLGDEQFLEFVFRCLSTAGVAPQNVCFEVTETVAVKNLSKATAFIKALREHGCRFSLDDFGTGLSSFAYLKSLPVDYLKIDGSFVRDIVTDQVSKQMVYAIHQVGKAMDLETIAEFVENGDIRAQLTEIGVDYAQGYAVGKPIPFESQLEQLTSKPVTQ